MFLLMKDEGVMSQFVTRGQGIKHNWLRMIALDGCQFLLVSLVSQLLDVLVGRFRGLSHLDILLGYYSSINRGDGKKEKKEKT